MYNVKWMLLSLMVVALATTAQAAPSAEQTRALRMAIEDLTRSFPGKYPRGAEFLKRLDAVKDDAEFAALKREALLANPLLDFESLMIVKRGDAANPAAVSAAQKAKGIANQAVTNAATATAEIVAKLAKLTDKKDAAARKELVAAKREASARESEAKKAANAAATALKKASESGKIGLPHNWQCDTSLPKTGYDNEIALLSPVSPDGKLKTLFRPSEPVFVGDVDLDFDGSRMMFSMPTSTNSWQVWEVKADGSGLRQVTPSIERIDNFDACYLPDGKIIFNSTMNIHGVPCVGGGDKVANLCRMDADGKNLRMLTFDQDQNWYPRVLNDGRVMYTRWEYSDTPHYFTRLLMRMNPDGTSQLSLYGSNSFWPNSLFCARQVPGALSKIVAVISGHHGVARMGELIVFDLEKGRFEANGAAQRITGYGKKVEPIIGDQIVANSWPKFLHPYPLSEKYFLVSCKLNATAPWGVYLVDIYDNMLCLCEQPGYAMLEPIPFRPRTRPQVLPDRVKPEEKEGTVILSDVYAGPGLKDVPRGTVKNLRLYAFHYGYWRVAGHINVGIDGPWDVRRILGTVPVYEDGSAHFKVPANTPIAIQPLNERGEALAVMRSWFVTMPGENASCVGCHESVNSGPPSRPNTAMRNAPSDIASWRGPVRGFSFRREVQPVLDKLCAGCHDGKNPAMPNFRADQPPYDLSRKKGNGFLFDASYAALMPYVRRPGPESDFHVLTPLEYQVNTSELFQMLRKSHHGVKLDAEAWDRLTTWVDLNVPDHGTWGEHRSATAVAETDAMRRNFRKLYAGLDDTPEVYPPSVATLKPVAFVKPPAVQKVSTKEIKADDWPFDAAEAKRRQNAAGTKPEQKVDLGDGVTMEMSLIPAGEFVMGDANGCADEAPQARVRIEKSFYMAKFETTNEQFRKFNATHDSGVTSFYNKDVASRGVPMNGDHQPVVRVSWRRAQEFCAWLSQKTGKRFALPTEAQWEYACRAGTTTALNYGDVTADFSKRANLADANLLNLCRRDSPKWIPAVATANDGAVTTCDVGRYAPNAWGLFDMHGNAAQWTRSLYAPYPYREDDGRNDIAADGDRVARGGSFYDRPQRARSAFRVSYPSWQRVHNVGFRVILETDEGKPSTTVAAK